MSVWNVFSRYVLASAILWADEVLVFAMIMLAWLGAIACAESASAHDEAEA